MSYAANQNTPGGYSSGQDYITDLFKQAKELGFNTFRFFIQGDGSFLMNEQGE